MNFTLAYDQQLAVHRRKYLALYHALRSAILDGTLPGGTRLPSTRQLAQLYQVSRGSASQVYDMLLADGYIRTETGRGTFVSPESFGPAAEGGREGSAAEPDDGLKGGGAYGTAGASAPAGTVRTSASIALSAWGSRLMQQDRPAGAEPGAALLSFRSGGLRMEHFPYAEWRSALNYAAGKGGGLLTEQGPARGDEGLRQAIAGHLRITRGIRAEAGQIVLFAGSMQGIVLLTQLLLDAGKPAVVEEPGFHGIRRAVEMTGGRLLPGRVDESGLIPEDWDAGLLFVTPSRQYPTGAVLPLERRRLLLEWASRHNAVIVEDDYDSEFRWAGRPIEPLKALDREERVVYVGSFTNSMFAGLRLGFAVLPADLVAPVIAAKALYEPLPAGQLEQRALARFMATGGYGRHLRRLTRIYGERARLLRSLLEERLGGLFEPQPGDAGLHIYARWRRSPAEFAAFQAAARLRGADFRDAAVYQLAPGAAAACFSFAHLSPEEITEGISRLELAWKDVCKKARDKV